MRRILHLGQQQGNISRRTSQFGLPSPYTQEHCERARFMEALNDWSRFGPEDIIPPWFTGDIQNHGDLKRSVSQQPIASSTAL
ncbi:hypothetical protein KKF84_09045 [Myxococcota bacterium]|nr:hypothetical protein [Myxococcota bacterium]MBU1535456.1 hypothetical protein [Myxococcota bacterium]